MNEIYEVKRTFTDGITPPLYAPTPEGAYETRDEAVAACVEYIGEDMGVDNGTYDPDLWSGLSWEDHAKSIKGFLTDGGHYEYANLKLEIVKYEIGDRVRWDDPDDGISSGEYEIIELDGGFATIKNECGTVAEVPYYEINHIKDEEED